MEDNNNTPNIRNVPIDILLCILRLLTFYEQLTARSVCRYWRDTLDRRILEAHSAASIIECMSRGWLLPIARSDIRRPIACISSYMFMFGYMKQKGLMHDEDEYGTQIISWAMISGITDAADRNIILGFIGNFERVRDYFIRYIDENKMESDAAEILAAIRKAAPANLAANNGARYECIRIAIKIFLEYPYCEESIMANVIRDLFTVDDPRINWRDHIIDEYHDEFDDIDK